MLCGIHYFIATFKTEIDVIILSRFNRNIIDVYALFWYVGAPGSSITCRHVGIGDYVKFESVQGDPKVIARSNFSTYGRM